MRWCTKWTVALAAALLLFAGAGRAQDTAKKKEKEKEKETRAGAVRGGNGDEVKPAIEDPSYVIGEEDQLHIAVWKEPELTSTVPVRPDGKISLPLLNDVQAAGLTPMQLALVITERLRRYITEPQVTVVVTAINSRRIYIVGEVNRSGAFPMLPNMTVLQALSSAGGFSQFARLKDIYILRSEKGKQTKVPFNYKEVIKGERPEQNIVLKPGDTIVVP